MLRSIRTRFTTALIGLSVAPLLLTGIFLLQQIYRTEHAQALALQQETAHRVAAEVDSFFHGLQRTLETTLRVRGLADLTSRQQRQILTELLPYENQFERLRLLDAAGTELHVLHRITAPGQRQPGDTAHGEALQHTMARGQTHFGPVYFDADSGEPFMELSLPMLDPGSGELAGVLQAHARVKKVWQLLADLHVRAEESIYILDTTHRVVAHPNPSVVLRGTVHPVDETLHTKPVTGLDGNAVIRATVNRDYGSQHFVIVAEQGASRALALARHSQSTIAQVLLLSAAVAAALAFWLVRTLVRPLQRLAAAAQRIEGGDLAARAPLQDPEETAAVARAFNRMTSRLQQSLDELRNEIDVRKQAQQALTAQQAFTEAIIDALRDTLFVFDPATGQAHRWNRAFRKLSGYSDEEIAANPAPTTYYRGEDLIRTTQAVEELRRHGATTVELELCTRSGDKVPFEYSAARIAGGQGEAGLCVAIGRDLRERKHAQRAVQRREKQIRDIYQAARNVAFVIADASPEPRIVEFSPGAETVFGYSRHEVLGQPASRLHLASDCERFDEMRARMERGEVGFHGELIQVRSSGDTFPALFTLYPMFDDDGSLRGGLGVSIDISQRKQLEQQLRHAQKMEAIGTLAGGIAHDFNNILGAILGYTELSLLQAPPGSELRDHLQEVQAAGQRAKGLVQQILTFSRSEKEQRQTIALPPVVEEAVRLLRQTIPTTIAFHLDVAPDCGHVVADPTQVHQVVVNLGTNAYHAMGEAGGTLSIALQPVEVDAADARRHPDLQPGSYAVLCVADTGSGMDAATLAQAFDPFFTTKAAGRGTGMGLAVVHGIVKSHGGAITVDSQPGTGTSFCVYFPRNDAPASDVPVRATGVHGGSERVLLVDDEPAMAALADKLLSGLGYRVVQFTDSQAAWAAYDADPEAFDVLVSDQIMPRITGFELAQRILRRQPRFPVVLCTGFSDSIDADSARAAGIAGFVMKPYTGETLAAAVRRAVDARPE